jgi:hypothetical protein
MKRRANLVAWIVAVPSVSIATATLNEVVVTPENENKFNFSVVLSGKNGPRTFIVYAPDHVKGDCRLGLSIAELKSQGGQLIYSHYVEMAPAKKLNELRAEIGEPSHVLTLRLNYYCPENHALDGTAYVFSSADWEKSGRMR